MPIYSVEDGKGASGNRSVVRPQVLMSGGRSGGEMKNIIWADLPQHVTDGVGIVHVAQGIAARAGHTEYRGAVTGDKFSQITTVLPGNSKDQSLHTTIILISDGGYT
jgi:Fe-S cluster assembly scaffold protein SufB